ncbi:tripartite tricarboxylate transporter permease [Cellulosilyticum sp. I15G10I2]|uniref:tripartite tricarboxylate transporter permease n=1 Tax=Cellulosilyticum sp. I15G10I2 TaxID=1892843 RepID=UPI00085CD87E|nr:tripartite tricarboxylate transporter permease [Cellulosilyticum sp. I15G10I2]
MLELLGHGLAAVMSFEILFMIACGVAAGIAIGALPGLTATMGVALLLPLTFGMDAESGILLLLGIYAGAIYGGSISAILLKTPGTPAAAATALDGFEMSKRGEAGRALGISTVSSYIGGTLSVILLILISPQLAKIGLKFSAPEYFALAMFGLSIIASVSGKHVLKGIMAGVIGLLVSTVGIDIVTGYQRFTFGNMNLFNGFSFIPVMIGLFALSQSFISLEDMMKKISIKQTVSRVLPTWEDLKKVIPTAIRSGLIGTFIGIIPGAGGDIGAFVAYNEAKRFSKHPEKFGTGIPEAIAAPEAANNGVTGGAMVPLLTLGIPGDATTAIMLGALIMQGLQPGPLLFRDHGPLVYTIFIGFLTANLFMLILGFIGIKWFTKIIAIPSYILTPVIFVLCIVGSYAINNNFFDVIVMFISGIIGYIMQKLEFPASPIVLALILGPMAERELRKSLMMSGGEINVLFTRPISAVLLSIAVVTFFMPIIKNIITQMRQRGRNISDSNNS